MSVKAMLLFNAQYSKYYAAFMNNSVVNLPYKEQSYRYTVVFKLRSIYICKNFGVMPFEDGLK